ncbi:hypothetical protein K1719_006680 [Acacia pycnantha]|nr:hypothetical protein K1719_006680 [Acacia pycnantha]
MHTPKMKGMFKGFRYFTHMFENEKKSDMQIGFPTDVKHVAHIGWDGPSVNTPSWMNEFRSPSSYSAPLALSGSLQTTESDNAVKWVPEDSKSSSSRRRDLPELPKSSRRQLTDSVAHSPTREKSDKQRRSGKSSKPKDPSVSSRPARVIAPSDQNQGSESPSSDQSDIRRKARRKKSKENSGGGTSKSRLRASHSDPNSGSGSPVGPVRRSSKEQRPVEVDGRSENGSHEEFIDKFGVTSY